MPADKKTQGAIPFWIAILCALIPCILLAAVVLSGNPVPFTGSTVAPAGTGAAFPQACTPVFVQEVPVQPQTSATSTLAIALPPERDRIPYTERNFDEPVEAAIAWWMSPGFMDNTTEFRGYERKTTEGKLEYPEEHRIFFTFIQGQLDTAERESVLKSHQTLFRGVSPYVAGLVLNTSAYHEPAFASTSYAFGVRSPDGYRNVLVLERNAGDHALYINEDEREYLLPRAMDWTVVKAENVENLTVAADFTLHNRTTGTASFDHVRLIYLEPAACLAGTG
jgi:hypothetical protein